MSMLSSFGDSIIGNIEKAVLIIPRFNLEKKQSNSDPYRLEVQFNPSELKLVTNSGTQYEKGHSSTAFQNLTIRRVDPTTSLTINLIFDAVNNQDAFLWDMLHLSLSSIIPTVPALVSKFGGKNSYSVRKYSEALAAMTFLPQGQHVKFLWGRMMFEGALKSVKVKFTMFNPNGEPIRSVVAIALQDSVKQVKTEKMKKACNIRDDTKELGSKDNSNDSTTITEYPHWKRALNDFLGDSHDDMEINKQSSLQKLSTILNL